MPARGAGMLAGEPQTAGALLLRGCWWWRPQGLRQSPPSRNTHQSAFPHLVPPAFDNRDPGSRYFLVNRPGSRLAIIYNSHLLHPFTPDLHVANKTPIKSQPRDQCHVDSPREADAVDRKRWVDIAYRSRSCAGTYVLVGHQLGHLDRW